MCNILFVVFIYFFIIKNIFDYFFYYFSSADGSDQIALTVNIFYKSLKDSKIIQMKPNLTKNFYDVNNANNIHLAEKCAKISEIICSDSHRLSNFFLSFHCLKYLKVFYSFDLIYIHIRMNACTLTLTRKHSDSHPQ